jgi:hypothetical protein
MPTVGRWSGITVLAYFLDHEKWDEHVHCRAGEAAVKISLLDFSVKRSTVRCRPPTSAKLSAS